MTTKKVTAKGPIRQLDPIPAYEGAEFGYVEELGWGHPVYFAWMKGRERMDGQDKAAERQSSKEPGQAIVFAFALWKGWGEQAAQVFSTTLAAGPNVK